MGSDVSASRCRVQPHGSVRPANLAAEKRAQRALGSRPSGAAYPFGSRWPCSSGSNANRWSLTPLPPRPSFNAASLGLNRAKDVALIRRSRYGCCRILYAEVALLRCHEAQGAREVRPEISAMYNGVEHTVFKEEFAALKALRQLLADRLLDDPWTGKANQRPGFGDVEVAKHCIGCGHSARGRVREN